MIDSDVKWRLNFSGAFDIYVDIITRVTNCITTTYLNYVFRPSYWTINTFVPKEISGIIKNNNADVSSFCSLFQPWFSFWIIRNLAHRWIISKVNIENACVRFQYVSLIFRCNLESSLDNVYIRITCLIIIQWYLIQQISNFPLLENDI